MAKRFVLTNCCVISNDLFIRNGEVVIDGNRIVAVGETGKTETSIGSDASSETWDLGGRFLMPGFVNPHAHLYSALSPGLQPKGPTRNFSEVLSNFWWPLDAAHNRESVYFSAVSGMLDAIRHGVTCIFDHHASMNFVEGSLDAIAEAFRLSGIKGVLCFETSDRESSVPVEKHVAENIRFADEHSTDGHLRGVCGLHANLTLSDSTLKTVSAMLSESGYAGRIHIHCGEDISDLEYCRGSGYEGPVDRLDRFGLVSSDSILAHCIHLSGRDRDILNNTEPWIVSNPESNANNRVGSPDRGSFPSYLIGTDGMSQDMVASLRAQYLLGSGLSEDYTALYNSFITKPSELVGSFFKSAGRIEAGMDADIAVLDYIPETPVDSENILGHLIYGARGGQVYMTVSDGRILYVNGKMTFIFESSIREQIKNAAAALHRRYYG